LASSTKNILNEGLQGLLNYGLQKLVSFVGSIFGKSPTKKAIEAMQTSANAALINEQKQAQTLKIVLIAFAALAGIVLFVFVLRKRK
jgi:hypothetical protein